MAHIETVEVVHPNDPAQKMRINRSDLKGTHTLWDHRKEATPKVAILGQDTLAVPIGQLVEPTVPYHPAQFQSPYEVAKGPRGLWFVKLDGATASKGFYSQEKAVAALAEIERAARP